MLYDNDKTVEEATNWLRSNGHNVLQIFMKDTEEAQADFLLERFQPKGTTVLDIGSGTGELARLMKRRRPDLEFILLNISGSQLDISPPDMWRIQGDAHHIPLGDGSVDNVMACYVMGHLRKEEALKEFERVVRPGGVIFIYDVSGGYMPAPLEYTAHKYEAALDVSDEVTCEWFLELMPDFREQFPEIKPVIVRYETG